MKSLLSGRNAWPLTSCAALVALVMVGTTPDASFAAKAHEGGVIEFKITREYSMRVPKATSMRWSYRTENGTADADSDFKPASGIVTFPWSGGTRTVRVKTLKDCNVEPDQYFYLKFYNLEFSMPYSRQLMKWHNPARTYGVPRTMRLKGKIIDTTPEGMGGADQRGGGSRCREGW